MTTGIQKVITIATAISYITYRKVKHLSKSANMVLQRVMCSCGMFGMEVNIMDVNGCIIQEGYFFIFTSCFGYAFMLIWWFCMYTNSLIEEVEAALSEPKSCTTHGILQVIKSWNSESGKACHVISIYMKRPLLDFSTPWGKVFLYSYIGLALSINFMLEV